MSRSQRRGPVDGQPYWQTALGKPLANRPQKGAASEANSLGRDSGRIL